jgi:hypothetical protein
MVQIILIFALDSAISSHPRLAELILEIGKESCDVFRQNSLDVMVYLSDDCDIDTVKSEA